MSVTEACKKYGVPSKTLYRARKQKNVDDVDDKVMEVLKNAEQRKSIKQSAARKKRKERAKGGTLPKVGKSSFRNIAVHAHHADGFPPVKFEEDDHDEPSGNIVDIKKEDEVDESKGSGGNFQSIKIKKEDEEDVSAGSGGINPVESTQSIQIKKEYEEDGSGGVNLVTNENAESADELWFVKNLERLTTRQIIEIQAQCSAILSNRARLECASQPVVNDPFQQPPKPAGRSKSVHVEQVSQYRRDTQQQPQVQQVQQVQQQLTSTKS